MELWNGKNENGFKIVFTNLYFHFLHFSRMIFLCLGIEWRGAVLDKEWD